MDHCSVFSTQGNSLERQEAVEVVAASGSNLTTGNYSSNTAGNYSNNGREKHCIDTGNHSNAAGNGGTRRKRPQRDTSSRSSEESFGTEEDHISVKRDLDTNTQDFSGDLEDSSQGWQLLDTCEPCNDEEVVKGRLKFFFMNLADKFHVTRTIPYHLCLQVKLHSAIKIKYRYTKKNSALECM